MTGWGSERDRMGLRERKRLERNREILEAAATIFSERGFADARMEEVAALADVSPGTVYNYFPTKDALLLAVARRRRSEIPAAEAKLIANPPADPVRAVVRFFDIMAEHSMRSLNKVLWCHVHAAMMVGDWETQGKDRWDHEDDLIARGTALMEALIEAGSLPADVPARRLAVLVHASAFFWWQRFLMKPDFTKAEFLALLKKDVQSLFGRTGAAVKGRAAGTSRGSPAADGVPALSSG